MGEIRLVERDYLIFRELERWRVLLGRHIKTVAGFSGQRACDRRLSKLIETGYVERKKILYGVPAIYKNTYRAKQSIHVTGGQEKIRTEQIIHDIEVIETAIYFNKSGTAFSDMTTEKQLHMTDGFSNRNHRPDFIFTKDNKKTCVEIELSLKSKHRLESIIKANFLEYDFQIWVVPNTNPRVVKILKENETLYPNIEILELSEVYNCQ